eukprot:scaffold194499_cov35-Prasinocladus_malaysianus.AAC.1
MLSLHVLLQLAIAAFGTLGHRLSAPRVVHSIIGEMGAAERLGAIINDHIALGRPKDIGSAQYFDAAMAFFLMRGAQHRRFARGV